jgi:hypothetical protein
MRILSNDDFIVDGMQRPVEMMGDKAHGRMTGACRATERTVAVRYRSPYVLRTWDVRTRTCLHTLDPLTPTGRMTFDWVPRADGGSCAYVRMPGGLHEFRTFREDGTLEPSASLALASGLDRRSARMSYQWLGFFLTGDVFMTGTGAIHETGGEDRQVGGLERAAPHCPLECASLRGLRCVGGVAVGVFGGNLDGRVTVVRCDGPDVRARISDDVRARFVEIMV